MHIIPKRRAHGLRLAVVFNHEGRRSSVYTNLPFVSVRGDGVVLGSQDCAEPVTERLYEDFLPVFQYDAFNTDHPATVTCQIGNDGYLIDPHVSGVRVVRDSPRRHRFPGLVPKFA